MHRAPISQTLRQLLAAETSGVPVTLGDAVLRIGDQGFGLLLVLLALPSALPIPAAGYSTVFGIMLAVIALQMIFGRRAIWMPAWARKRVLSGGFVEKMLSASAGIFSRIEYLVRPRMRWVGSKAAVPLMGVLVLIMACLMILPIPLTNTFPAFVIFLIGVGLTEEDGLFCLGACALGLVSVALYGGVIYFVLTHGVESIDKLKEIIKGTLGLG